MKRMMLACVILLAMFAGTSSAFGPQDFYRNPTGKDITWSELAKKMGKSEEAVRALAPVNRKGGLLSGEWVPTHDLGLGSWFAWFYHLGNESKVGLEGQAKVLPKDLRAIVLPLIQNKTPVKKVTLKWGQTLDWVSFQVGKKPRFFENAVCLWQNPTTGKIIPELTAYVWEGTNIGYVTGCFNLFALAEMPAPIPAPTEEAKQIVPTPEPTTPPTPVPTKAPVVKEAEEPSINPQWGEGVLWLVPEYVSAEGLSQANLYAGLEWRRKLSNRWWWVIRGEAGPGWNKPDEGPDTFAQTSNLRTGLRYRLFDKAPVALDIEAGILGWYHSEHYAQFYWDGGPSYLEGDATETSGGGYVRLLGKSKAETYYELEYRNAGLEDSFAGNLTTEPKRLYFEIGGGQTNYDELDDDGTVYRQDGEFTEFHVKAGYKLAVKKPFVIAGTWQTWKYSSKLWEINWNNGYGLYVESRFDPKGHWRGKLHGIYFADREDGPPGEPKSQSHEVRVQMTLTYAW